jgi:hypothetical protein
MIQIPNPVEKDLLEKLQSLKNRKNYQFKINDCKPCASVKNQHELSFRGD